MNANKTKTRSTTQPTATKLTEAELKQVNGGIIAILIGKASQAISAVSVPRGTPLF